MRIFLTCLAGSFSYFDPEGCFMKIVVWKSPKFLKGFLRMLFGIRKEY